MCFERLTIREYLDCLISVRESSESSVAKDTAVG